MKKKALLIWFLLFGSCATALCQYIGGNGRGDMAIVIANINANDFTLFHGGNGRGDIAQMISNVNAIDFTLFHGGNGRGDIALATSDVNAFDFQLFHGGNGRGDMALAGSDINASDYQLFHGGNGRGDMALASSDINASDYQLFHGGNGRGDMALASTDVNASSLQLFRGGNGRGDMALASNDVNASGFQLFHGGNGRGDIASLQYDVDIPSCLFPDIPILNVSNDTICNGQSAILSIAAGSLHSASHWQWYSGSCGGASVGSGASITVSPSLTTMYYARGEGACIIAGGCANISISLVVCGSTLHLTLFLEGYYDSSGNMVAALLNEGVGLSSTLTDSITVELHQTAVPFGIVESKKVALNTNGTATCIFNSSGIFYVAVRHRNTVTTWSASPIIISALSNYNFTDANSKAYGNNQIEVEPNKWALYSGDLNQDENIDLLDLSPLEIDINNFSFGYFATDINGDGNVDLLDNPLIEENINNFVFSVHP